MSSVVTIGFLDRTRVCIQTEFTPPLADDEHRELLIHAAMLTGRAFAALPPERQLSLAGILKEWIAERFTLCPVQIVAGDPMACPQRFASTFLAPVREYALATSGCDQEGGIEYFLPMAAVAFLRFVVSADADPDELLKPALALCAAVAIHPVTVGNHFRMAAASLPKIAPVVDRTPSADPVGGGRLAKRETKRHLLETRRSLVVSACLAALAIMVGVQYLSTREPKTAGEAVQRTPAKSVPAPLPRKEADSAPKLAMPEVKPTIRPPAPKRLSPQTRAYLRKARDLAENSLAQVEVMLAAADRKGRDAGKLAETLEYGTGRLRAWRRQFAALTPPRALRDRHREIGALLAEFGDIAQTLRSSGAQPSSQVLRKRLSAMHSRLEQVLNEADAD